MTPEEKAKSLLNSDEQYWIVRIKRKLKETKNPEEKLMLQHHLKVIFEKVIYREKFKKGFNYGNTKNARD